MRLSGRLKVKIINILSSLFAEGEAFILFGSRVDINKVGGDIDIAVKSSISAVSFKKRKNLFFTQMMREDLDLKIDLVQYNSEMDELLKKEIDIKGVAFKN